MGSVKGALLKNSSFPQKTLFYSFNLNLCVNNSRRMAKNEDVPPSTREITDSASFGDNCCATAERKLFVDLDGTVA